MELVKQNIFATPESSQALQDYIEQFPKEQKAALYTVAGMAWNFACKTVEKANELQKEDNKRRSFTSEEMLCRSHGFTVMYDGTVQDRTNPSDDDYPEWDDAEQCIYDRGLR